MSQAGPGGSTPFGVKRDPARVVAFSVLGALQRLSHLNRHDGGHPPPAAGHVGDPASVGGAAYFALK